MDYQNPGVDPKLYMQNVMQPSVGVAPQPPQPPQPPVRVVPLQRPPVRPAATEQPVEQYQQSLEPEVRVVRRNLTVAELLVVILIAMLGVSAVQFAWGAIPKPQIEVQWK